MSTKKKVSLSRYNENILVLIILFVLRQIYRLVAIRKDRFSEKTAFCSETIFIQPIISSVTETFKRFVTQFKITLVGKNLRRNLANLLANSTQLSYLLEKLVFIQLRETFSRSFEPDVISWFYSILRLKTICK